MPYISKAGYLERKTMSSTPKSAKGATRDWWLIKPKDKGFGGSLELKAIYFPRHLVGKRVRFKVEFID